MEVFPIFAFVKQAKGIQVLSAPHFTLLSLCPDSNFNCIDFLYTSVMSMFWCCCFYQVFICQTHGYSCNVLYLSLSVPNTGMYVVWKSLHMTCIIKTAVLKCSLSWWLCIHESSPPVLQVTFFYNIATRWLHNKANSKD